MSSHAFLAVVSAPFWDEPESTDIPLDKRVSVNFASAPGCSRRRFLMRDGDSWQGQLVLHLGRVAIASCQLSFLVGDIILYVPMCKISRSPLPLQKKQGAVLRASFIRASGPSSS